MIYDYWCVVWNMTFIFPFELGMSSSQLTFIFSEGWLNHQPRWYISLYIYIYIHIYIYLPDHRFSTDVWLPVDAGEILHLGYGGKPGLAAGTQAAELTDSRDLKRKGTFFNRSWQFAVR